MTLVVFDIESVLIDGEFRQIPGLIRDRLHPTHRQPTTTIS